MSRAIGIVVVYAGVLACAPAAGLGALGLLGLHIELTPFTWSVEVLVMAVSNNYVLRAIIARIL